jgi:hemoglobin
MRRIVRHLRIFMLAALILVTTLPMPGYAQDATLYDRLGGQAAIEAVVDQLLMNVAADDRINGFFVGTDLGNLRRLLVEQVCEATGGPCTYTGRSMADVHRGLGLTQAHFTALVEDLVAALDAFSVPEAEKSELLGLLGPMQGDIVDSSLYARLGGMPAIEAAIDGLLANAAADARINGFFAGADLGNLRRLLVEQVCQATGGPCIYTGRSMADAHRGLGITQEHFTALVEDLVAALNALGVPEQERGELLGLLGPMQSDIVAVPLPAPAPPPSQQLPPPLPAPPTTVPASPVPPTATTRPITNANVDIRSFTFNPGTVTVPVGSTVTWRNADTVSHTATGTGFDTGALTNGQTGTAMFSTAGTISYMCRIHPNMRGTIIVQ